MNRLDPDATKSPPSGDPPSKPEARQEEARGKRPRAVRLLLGTLILLAAILGGVLWMKLREPKTSPAPGVTPSSPAPGVAPSAPQPAVAPPVVAPRGYPVTVSPRKGQAGRQGGEVMWVDFDGGVKMEFLWVPPGEFMMGSPETEAQRGSDERQQRVKLSKGFWIGKYEVTNEQWDRVLGSNPGVWKGAKLPVDSVNWKDCQEFIQKVNSEATGRGTEVGQFRLPTAAEWEYACRAGTTTVFHYGDSLDSSMANFDGNFPYGSGNEAAFPGKTVEVGSYKPNAFGLYDMHGNAWEWCQDWYGEYPEGDLTDPEGAPSGSLRVVRGGCWNESGKNCRSALRNKNNPDYRVNLCGFRVAADVGPWEPPTLEAGRKESPSSPSNTTDHADPPAAGSTDSPAEANRPDSPETLNPNTSSVTLSRQS